MKKVWVAVISIAILNFVIAGGYLLTRKDSPDQKTATTQPVAKVEPENTPTPTVQGMFELTNQVRVKAGQKPLELDERLNKSAQAKADDIYTSREYSHTNPITGKRGLDYISDNWPECPKRSENLAITRLHHTSQEAIDLWMGSATHQEALMHPHNFAVGFGVRDKYVVQHFCRTQ